jgi:hypothetical protein
MYDTDLAQRLAIYVDSVGFKRGRFIDGYEVFTPPESAYDPVKVKFKLWARDGAWQEGRTSTPMQQMS